MEEKIGDGETNDMDIGDLTTARGSWRQKDPGVVPGAASSSGMTDQQRQEKRQSRERRDAGNAEGDEETQETELKQKKRSADKDVKNQDSKKQVQGEMDVDAVQSGETSDTFWEDEVDVDTEWKMMQEIEGRSAKEASRIMSDTAEICSFNRNVEEDAIEFDDTEVGRGTTSRTRLRI